MCIFKHEQTDTGCGHSECKNFYMLNKQFCMHSPLNLPMPNSMFNISSVLPPHLAPPLLTQNLNLQQSLNTKRMANPSDKDLDKTESGYLNKKKIKLEDERASRDAHHIYQSSMDNTLINSVSEIGGNQQQSLNDILRRGDSQPGDLHFSHLMAPNMRLSSSSQTSVAPDYSAHLSSEFKPEQTSSSEISMKEFQTKTLDMLSLQSQMMASLKDKNDSIQGTLASLINEINILKTAISQHIDLKTVVPTNALASHQNISNTSETASAETLISYLYGPKINFKYHLVLKDEMELPLYRERNFKFTIMLVDQNGKFVANANRIPLTIGIYSSENPPKYIDVNTAGNKILKGFIEKDLINGAATFEKIQVKDVTSHFRNGWIFFVVYPKVTKNPNNNVLKTGNGVHVDIQAIKPLIVEKVIVKAKKIKEKDQNTGDETPSSQNDDFR